MPEIFQDEKFRNRLDSALTRAGAAVRGDKAVLNTNSTLGLIVREDGYAIEPERPDGLIPRGRENRGQGFLKTNFFYSEAPIEGAAAIAVSVPTFYRNDYILEDASRWNRVSVNVNAPVVVRGDRSNTWVFTGSGEPIKYR